ncbi:MAG: LapA family protein [Cyanobacteriota bacterium]|nr:LapA family protein [Cyanobacteriota bacterium]
MKTLANGLSSIIVATWAIAIAVFSVQNYTLISLNFLTFTSVPIPLGVLLAFCFAGGLVLGGIAPLFLGRRKAKKTLPRDSYIDNNDPLENWSE